MRRWQRILATLLLTQAAGCATGPIGPETLVLDGHVVHQDTEGGFWAIAAEDGRNFVPLELPDAYRKTQLRVRVKAIPRPDVMSIHMYGPIIEIQEISVLP